MDFINRLQALATIVEKQNVNITTAEETKKAYVVPFIQALGYDVFDPTEVLPNFTAGVGCQEGEKVDYAILIENKPALLIECKPCDSDLNDAHAAQLRKCFQAAAVHIGILTNGKTYYFYSDREEQYIMDAEPFMKLDLLNIRLAPIVKAAFKQFADDYIANNGSTKRSHNDIIVTDEEFERYFVVDVT